MRRECAVWFTSLLIIMSDQNIKVLKIGKAFILTRRLSVVWLWLWCLRRVLLMSSPVQSSYVHHCEPLSACLHVCSCSHVMSNPTSTSTSLTSPLQPYMQNLSLVRGRCEPSIGLMQAVYISKAMSSMCAAVVSDVLSLPPHMHAWRILPSVFLHFLSLSLSGSEYILLLTTWCMKTRLWIGRCTMLLSPMDTKSGERN